MIKVVSLFVLAGGLLLGCGTPQLSRGRSELKGGGGADSVFSSTTLSFFAKNNCQSVPGLSCYFTHATGFFNFSYLNDKIPQDSRVFLHSGFGHGYGSEENKWVETKDIELTYDKRGEVWTGVRDAVLYGRGGPVKYSIQFDFIIVLPWGEVWWDKGNLSPAGYYQAQFAGEGFSSRCYPLGEVCSLEITHIEKDWDKK